MSRATDRRDRSSRSKSSPPYPLPSNMTNTNLHQSIYPGQAVLSKEGDHRIISMSIPISLPTEINVVLLPSLSRSSRNGESSSSSMVSEINYPDLKLSHLPPLSARIVLPSNYPVDSSSRVIHLEASLGERSNWLPRSALQAVKIKLEQMWTEEKEAMGEGAGVLWRWLDWVGSGEFLTELGMLGSELRYVARSTIVDFSEGCSCADIIRLSVPPSLPVSTFHTLLKTYNATQLHSSFEQTAFSCTICFENRKGKSCVLMPCGCVL